MPDPLTFHDCLMSAARNREFVEAYDRLRGTNLSLRGSPLDLAIDEMSGRRDAELGQFCADVFDLVFLRLPPEAVTW